MKVIEMNEERFRALIVPALFCDRRGHAIVMKPDGDGVLVNNPLLKTRRRESIDAVRGQIFGAAVLIVNPSEEWRS